METINPIYNLGRVAVKDESTEKMCFYEVPELQTNGSSMPQTQRTLRFRIDDLNSYLVPSRSYIQLSYRLNNNDNVTPLDATQIATLKNNGFGIFRRAVFRMNNQAINSYSDYNYHKADLEVLFKSNEWKHSMGSLCGVRDTLSDNDGWFNPTDALIASNEGLVYTTQQFRKLNPYFNKSHRTGVASHGISRENTLNIPLHALFPFLSAYDRVVRGVQMEIELELADETIIIEQSTGVNAKFSWSGRGAILFVKKVVPSLAVRNELNNAITRGFSLKGFSFEDVEVYRNSIANNASGSLDWRISTTISRPTKVFIAFQDAEVLTDKRKSVSYFTGCGVQEIQLFVNGQPIPDLRYEVNLSDDYDTPAENTDATFASGNYINLLTMPVQRDMSRAYNNLLSLTGQDMSSVSSDLNQRVMSYDDWRGKYLVYPFDVSNNLPQDTAFTGASEILVRFRLNTTYGQARHIIAWVYHEKLADINLTSTESSIVIS